MATANNTQMTDEPDIITENATNWLIEFPDGSVKPVTKSPKNRLLYDHGMWGLLNGGDEIIIIEDSNTPAVQIIPNETSTEFTIEIEDGQPITLGEYKRSKLIDALMKAVEAGDDDGLLAEPIIDFYERIRRDQVRTDVMEMLGEIEPFASTVEVWADGWYIRDHLLLTWEQEFYHPDTTTRSVSGSDIRQASSEPAYDIHVSRPDRMDRTFTLEGESYRLTDAEMTFLAKGLWAITNAPDVDHGDDLEGTPGL